MKKIFSFLAAVLFAGSMMADPVWTVVTSIAVNDVVVIAQSDVKQELSGFAGSSTKYGTGAAFTTAPAGTKTLTVVAGNSEGTFAFKTSDNKYLTWTSGNSLNVNATLSDNTSWKVSFSNDHAVIKNAADEARELWWNVSSPRFACYTDKTHGDSYKRPSLYKSLEPASVEKPVIAGDAYFFDEFEVEITCGTTGAAIHYTLDGSDPTAESALYNSETPFTINATTTVKAIAINGDDASEIATKVFTKNPSYASFSALIAAELESHTLVEVAFSNIVIDSIYLNSSSSKRYGIYFAVNGVAYEIYCNKAEIPAAWEAGDKISGTIRGDWYSFNGLWEIVPSAADWAWTELTRTPDARMHGAYTVGGENADFATLSAAATALRTRGLKADVDFVVCADTINEVANIGLVNETDFTVTIRPNDASLHVISFGSVADNVGPSGHVVIGYDMAAWAATPTKNVVIDGSFEDDGQFLEFLGGTEGGVVVVYYGHVTNSVVKNCRLISPRKSKTTYVAHFRTEQLAGGTPAEANRTDNAPEGVGFENCYMQVTGVGNAQAVYYNGSNSKTAAGKPKQCYVRGCEIISNLRGAFYYGAIDPIFENNTVRINGYSTGMLSHGINGTTVAGTVIVRGNRFEHLESYNSSEGDYGMQGITASGGATVWMIENNYFAGMTASYNTLEGKAVKLLYVRCGDSCVVRHNTFHMPVLAKKPSTALGADHPIACLHLAGAKKYIVKNNIFVSEETVANNSLIRGGLNENCGNNVFFHAGGNCAVNAATANAMTWDEFTANGANAGSVWKLPDFVNAAEGDLAIKTADADLLMPRLADVLKDITGADRRENTYAGAFEGPEPSQGTGLDAVEVEGVQKIFRNGEVLIIRDGKTYNMMGQIVR